jgi:hypothetical protein|tara:strand:+ start:14 stop:601 length:588 start_codon:yes stop_codon:yes gene_type:complete
MKKLIIILFAGLLTFSLSAQQFGVRGGISLASIYGSDADDIDDKTIMNPGIIIGGFGQFGEDNIRTTVELLYIQKGFKIADDGDYMRAAANYLETNIMGNFFVSDMISLNGGVYLGYLSGVTLIYKIDGDKDSESADLDDDDRRIDFGSNLGVTFYLNDAMNIDIRYGLGLIGLDEDVDLFNSTIQISFSYAFGG